MEASSSAVEHKVVSTIKELMNLPVGETVAIYREDNPVGVYTGLNSVDVGCCGQIASASLPTVIYRSSEETIRVEYIQPYACKEGASILWNGQ